MKDDAKLSRMQDWQDRGFDKNLSRPQETPGKLAQYIGGADFDSVLDELLFNRMIRLKDLRQIPQGNDPGKIYWDGENKQFKIWIDETGQWADVIWTSTSTSTSSTSSSSTSTTTTL